MACERHPALRSPGPGAPAERRCYLHAVWAAQERRLLHPEVVGDQRVEAIGEIQDLGVAAALGHCLQERGQREQTEAALSPQHLAGLSPLEAGCCSRVPRQPAVRTGQETSFLGCHSTGRWQDLILKLCGLAHTGLLVHNFICTESCVVIDT